MIRHLCFYQFDLYNFFASQFLEKLCLKLSPILTFVVLLTSSRIFERYKVRANWVYAPRLIGKNRGLAKSALHIFKWRALFGLALVGVFGHVADVLGQIKL